MERSTEDAIERIVTALTDAFQPNRLEIVVALRRLAQFVPHDVPAQFTNPVCHATYSAAEIKKRKDLQTELAEDAKQPFFSESYLYNLLGKEDARTLLGRFRGVCVALGIPEESLYEREGRK